MLENQGDIVEWLRAKSFTENDIQQLSQLLQRHVHQDVKQSGKFNINISDGSGIQIGDGATPEQIGLIVRELVQELKLLQPDLATSIQNFTKQEADITNELDLEDFILDLAAVEAINTRLRIIQEIYDAGYLTEVNQPDFAQLRQDLAPYAGLKNLLKKIEKQGDRLIEYTIANLRKQLEDLRLSGANFTENPQIDRSSMEIECQQAEAQTLQNFISTLAESRLGAEWITRNQESLSKYARKTVLRQFPSLQVSEQKADDFQFSIKQFLEQISFCLYWGTYDILDFPDIPFELEIEHYETAFQAIKETVSSELTDETVHAIKACLDYLISRLPLIEASS
ncbi:MAG: hypothetical protein ACTS3T_21715 [Almyronema sp.]